MDYKIRLEIKGVYNDIYTEENISLGTSIKETLDKSYDMLTLELLLTNRLSEYQPYTPVTVVIYENNEDGSMKYGITYHMVIESDEVKDVYIGTKTKYNHNLVLIEETKLLETELMPNITFTQPVKNLSATGVELIDNIQYQPLSGDIKGDYFASNLFRHYEIRYNIPENKPTKKIVPGSKLPNISITFNFKGNPLTEEWWGWSISKADAYITIYPSSVLLKNATNSYELANPVYKTVEAPETYFGEKYLKASFSEYRDEIIVPDNVVEGTYDVIYSFNVTDIFIANLTWWPFDKPYVKVTDIFDISYENALGNNETLNFKGTLPEMINSLAKIAIRGYSFSNPINKTLESEPIYLNQVLQQIEDQTNLKDRIITKRQTEKLTLTGNVYSTPINSMTDTKQNRFLNLRFDLDRTSIILSLAPTVKTNIVFLDTQGGILLKVPRYHFLIGQPVKKSLYYNLSVPENAKSFYITVEIGNYTVSNLKTEVSQVHPPKYTFSDNIKSRASTIIAPEYTFEAKTLWEICLEIGEMLNGIPVLNDSVIDYLILDDQEAKTISFDKEDETKASNMSNYATKLFTPQLKNIIQDESFSEAKTYSVYPSPNGWIKARAADYSSTSIDRQTSAIVIDNEQSGIYKIRKVLCKFNNKEYNISRYVLEKSIFQSLSKEVNANILGGSAHEVSEQGTHLYYERGKNVIHNIAQLPENGSLIGWKQTFLTIQFILFLEYAIPLTDSSKDIFSYEFRVEYYPYHSRLNISRQSNLNDIYNQVTNNFNQTSNNVSALQFSKHAEETLNKLGNAEITTRYTTNKLIDDLNIGDCLVLNGKNYYINQKFTTFNNKDKTVNLNLTKDNYKQDTRIAVSREYRQYNIDSSNVLRKTLSKPYSIMVSTNEITLSPNTSYIGDFSSSNRRSIAKSIIDTIKPGYYNLNKITNAFIHVQNFDASPLQFNTFRTDVPPSTCGNKILPVIGDVIGNTMTFQWDMYDNFSAGRQVRDPSTLTSNWWNDLEISIGTVTLKEKDYGLKIQDDCRYCDDNGGTPSVYSVLFSNNNFSFPVGLSDSFPETTITQEGISQYGECVLSSTFDACKDSREALSFQTTVSMQTFDKDIKIFNILKYNPFVSYPKESAPQWYGYKADNMPSDNQFYRFNPNYKLNISYSKTYDTSSLTTVVQYKGKNTSLNDYLGYILCYENGEVLIDVRKRLPSKSWINLYFNIFNDEINLRDINYIEEDFPVTDIRDYKPIISLVGDRLYLDIDDLKLKTGLDPQQVTINLGTKHNTQPRGIQGGYKSRKYAKSNRNRDTYRVGNNWLYNGSVFYRIYTGPDGELLFDDGLNLGVNLQRYITSKDISNQDLGRKPLFDIHIMLKYAITLSYKGLSSLRSNYENVTYTNTTKKVQSFTID